MDKKLNNSLSTKLIHVFGERNGYFLFKVIRNPKYHQSINDLVAYTGLSFDEVCERVVACPGQQIHYAEEYKWESPGSPNALNWFYRSCRNYLFANASRPVWPAIEFLNSGTHPRVIDFGGGIGQNTIELIKRGFDVTYFDISIIETDFVKFRVKNRGFEVKVIEPYFNGRFNFFECIQPSFDAILLQDVLEHIPKYVQVLEKLSGCLVPGGFIVEYSPFNGKYQGDKLPKYNVLHLSEMVPLHEIMQKNKMQKTDWGVYPATVWKKES